MDAFGSMASSTPASNGGVQATWSLPQNGPTPHGLNLYYALGRNYSVFLENLSPMSVQSSFMMCWYKGLSLKPRSDRPYSLSAVSCIIVERQGRTWWKRFLLLKMQ